MRGLAAEQSDEQPSFFEIVIPKAAVQIKPNIILYEKYYCWLKLNFVAFLVSLYTNLVFTI